MVREQVTLYWLAIQNILSIVRYWCLIRYGVLNTTMTVYSTPTMITIRQGEGLGWYWGNYQQSIYWRGSSLPICACWMVSLVPTPLTWVEICWCTCLQSHLQASPPTLQKSYPKFHNPRTTFENTPLVRPNTAYCGWSPNLLNVWNPHIFVT